MVRGEETSLADWTPSSVILPDDWNVLRVTADGNTLSFYINDQLVWSGSDDSLAEGEAGVLMFRSTVVETLYVDWAALGMPVDDDPASESDAVETTESSEEAP